MLKVTLLNRPDQNKSKIALVNMYKLQQRVKTAEDITLGLSLEKSKYTFLSSGLQGRNHHDSNDSVYRDATECIQQLLDYNYTKVDENTSK